MAFCTKCGSAVPDGNKFCTTCGEPVEQMAPSVSPAAATAPSAPVAPVFTPSSTGRMPALATPAQPVLNYAAPKSATRSPMSATAKGAIVGVVCAVILVAVGLLVVFQPWAPAAEQKTAEPAAQKSEAKSSSATSTGEKSTATTNQNTAATESTAKATTPETDYTAQLTTQYNKLDGFHNRISEAATTFNADYVNASSATRSSDASVASGLASEISSAISELDKLGIPKTSDQYGKYQAIRNLLVDLQNRIGVINEAWKIDLGYSNPGDHVAEITAPLGRDNDGSGVNRYKTDYLNNYDAARP